MSVNREAVLETASSLIQGDRATQYGDAFDTHSRIATSWSAILGTHVTAQQVALCMAAVKLVRAAKSPAYADSYVDIAGYAALAAEMAGAE